VVGKGIKINAALNNALTSKVKSIANKSSQAGVSAMKFPRSHSEVITSNANLPYL
jgi:hypothetical protein